MIGFIIGALLTRWAWKTTIREKIKSGHRLELDGELYVIKVDLSMDRINMEIDKIVEKHDKENEE